MALLHTHCPCGQYLILPALLSVWLGLLPWELTSGGGVVPAEGAPEASTDRPRMRPGALRGEICRKASAAFCASRWAASRFSRLTMRFTALCFCGRHATERVKPAQWTATEQPTLAGTEAFDASPKESLSAFADQGC